MLTDALCAGLIALAAAAAAFVAAAALLLPIRARGVDAELVIRIGAGAGRPEHTLAGARFIARLAGIRARIIPDGADAETEDALRRFLCERGDGMYIDNAGNGDGERRAGGA